MSPADGKGQKIGPKITHAFGEYQPDINFVVTQILQLSSIFISFYKLPKEIISCNSIKFCDGILSNTIYICRDEIIFD